MDTKRHIRPVLIILLIITALFSFVLLGAGSHGNISMKNKETALIIYGGLVFILTAIANLISMRKKYSIPMGFLSFTLNLISILILTYYLIFSIRFNINGGHFPIFFLLVIALEIIIGGKIIETDLKQLNKNWIQKQL
ncbi:hypothetical protein [Meridianimaribacter flavus]|nr:hypothetical protein [Meridianimaribacter flavus]RYH75444.1 hypothetical protein EVU94_00345 [Flavobacteriaceae bacterium 144Ye]